MKKWLILIMIFLTGCSSNVEEASVVIDLEAINGLYVDEDIYVPVKELKKLDIDVLEDEHVAYLSPLSAKGMVSNNRPYNWYVDQGDTGIHAGDNCGPSATVMAAKWQNEAFDQSAYNARTEFRPSGGWWYTDDIKSYFNRYDVVYQVDEYDGVYELVQALNEGDIILLCLDTTFIDAKDESDSYVGRFYSYEGGHFLIVKGYVYIDEDLYFEVYDSNCWGESYTDGSPKGKDRLYPGDEIDEAVLEWWSYYFIIEDI